MVINFALVASTAVLSLIGSPAASRSHAVTSLPAAAETVAAIDPFNPPPPKAKKRRPPRPSSDGAQSDTRSPDELDEEPAPPPPRRSPPPVRRRPAAVEDSRDDEGAAQADDDEGEHPKIKKKARRRAAEEEEEESEDEQDDGPMASLPVILPRLISFEGGAAATGRNFQYNSPLQKESTFPRAGLMLALESFPLLRMPHGWWKTIGIGASLEIEGGAAALKQQATGASVSFPVSQRRWSVDVRYAIPVGARLVVIPSLGYGSNVFDLKTVMNTAPSACDNAQSAPCIADVTASHLDAVVHLRAAATSAFAVSLSAGYYIGLGVGKGAGQIGSERPATAVSGFGLELGANLMLMDWLALRAAVPFRRFSYSFSSGGAGTYSTATETYFGGTVGALLFLP